jgi:glyoxylase-like metal-dependent hydrolase (beta-lactamase superfamily II)
MAAPEQLAPNVYRIDAIGLSHAISVLAIAEDDGWTLVDTGTGGSPKRIQAALATLGVTPAALRTIYLTHHHMDHIAGLPGMCAWAPDAEIVAPEHDAQIIAGQQPIDPSSNRVMRWMQRWAKPPVVPVTRIVQEGDTIAGFQVIATPGHSLGHTSLLSDAHGLLMTADAFGVLPKKPRVGVRKAFCTDPAMAKRSAEKLLGYAYDTVVFSHGPVLRDNPKARLKAIVAQCHYT